MGRLGWQENQTLLWPPDPERQELQVDVGRARAEGTKPQGARPGMG